MKKKVLLRSGPGGAPRGYANFRVDWVDARSGSKHTKFFKTEFGIRFWAEQHPEWFQGGVYKITKI
jgi:hypothetical protein